MTTRATHVSLLTLLIALAPVACGDDSATSTTGSGGQGAAGASGGTGGTGGVGVGGSGGMMDVAPAAPTDFTLTVSESPFGVDLSWQAPPADDLAGFIVARHDSAFDASNAPVDGMTYSVGETLGGGATVIFVGTDTAALDEEAPIETTSHYAVFAFDEGGLHSEPATDSIDPGFPPQTGTIEISDVMTSPTVTVLEQPSLTTLAGTAAYDANTGELTLSLEITNLAERILFSPKAAVDGINAGTATADGTTVDGRPAAYYGPAGLAVGASASRDIVIADVGMADPVVIDLEILNNPMGFTNDDYNSSGVNFFDLSGAVDANGDAFGGQVSWPLGWQNPTEGRPIGGVFSPDAATFYAGWKSRPILAQVDMTTLQAVASADLSQGATDYGITSNVIASPDQTSLYTLVTTGAHRYSGGPNYANVSTVDLVKLDRATLAEQDRLNLITDAPLQMGQRPTHGNFVAASADGGILVAAVDPGQLWVIDTASFAVIDADAATGGDQPVDLTGVATTARIAAVEPDGSKAYVGFHTFLDANGNFIPYDEVAVVDLTTLAVTTINSTSTAGNNADGWSELAFGPDGHLYIARNYPQATTDVSLSVFDSATSTHDDLTGNLQIMGLLFHPAGDRYYLLQRDIGGGNNNGEILVFETGTHDPIDVDGDAGNGQTNLPVAGASAFSTHLRAITPF